MVLLDISLRTIEPPWFAGWGTLALVNAGLAQGKRRSGLAWFLVSLLLGPLATLLIVVLEPGSSRG
jgi:hypothetical protein